jgi:hypothetical protein
MSADRRRSPGKPVRPRWTGPASLDPARGLDAASRAAVRVPDDFLWFWKCAVIGMGFAHIYWVFDWPDPLCELARIARMRDCETLAACVKSGLIFA